LISINRKLTRHRCESRPNSFGYSKQTDSHTRIHSPHTKVHPNRRPPLSRRRRVCPHPPPLDACAIGVRLLDLRSRSHGGRSNDPRKRFALGNSVDGARIDPRVGENLEKVGARLSSRCDSDSIFFSPRVSPRRRRGSGKSSRSWRRISGARRMNRGATVHSVEEPKRGT
jgi:hypothetical protein